MNTRICSKCGKEQLEEFFYKSHLKHPEHWKISCKECINKIARLGNIRHPKITNNGLIIKGYIYIIINPAWVGWIKIGITKMSVEKRLLTYQTASPFRDYEIYYTKLVKDIYKSESNIHKLLDDKGYSRNNEWFSIDPEEAIKLIN